MQAGLVSRLRFCRRSWGLKIYFGWNIVHFWKSYICFNKLDVQEQTAVSHSSTESEIISLDAGLRLDGIPALNLWDLIVSVLGNTNQSHKERETRLWTNVKFVLHLTQFKNVSNIREWSTIWMVLIVFPQTSNLLIRKLCCMCLKTTKQWSRWS